MSDEELLQFMEEEGGGGSIYVAKSFIIDMATNQGLNDYRGLRSVDLYFEGSLITILIADLSAHDETSKLSASREAQYAFDTSLSKTGASDLASYLSPIAAGVTRIWVQFTNPKTFDKVVVNNWHESGASTGAGAKDIKMTITEDTGLPTTTYDAAVTGGVVIYNSTLDEHVAFDVQDDQILTLIP